MARTGRPRGFDRDTAVEQAMCLFWEHGYEATSLAHLRQGMGGISSASFYAAFASKEALFRETLALYVDSYGTSLAPLFDPTIPPRDAVEQALRASVDMQTDNGHPLGCLICASTVSCSPDAADVQQLAAEIRASNHAAIRACVDRAIALGQLPGDRNASAIAAMFNGFLLSISALARDGVERSTLHETVSEIMLVWPATSDSAVRLGLCA